VIKTVADYADDREGSWFGRHIFILRGSVHATRSGRMAGGHPRLASGAAITVVLVAVGACAAHPSGPGGSTDGSSAGIGRSALASPASISAPPDAFTVQDIATGNHFEIGRAHV